jgi:hypothetical protein
MWPGYQVRLGHVRRLRFVQVGHGQREDLPAERLGNFTEPLLHFSFSQGIQRWLEKHIRYAHSEASAISGGGWTQAAINTMLFNQDKTTRRRAAKSIAGLLPPFTRPLARFIYIYVFRLGFLDGMSGFVYAFMLSTYEAMTALFLFEITRRVNPSTASSGSEWTSFDRSTSPKPPK